MTITTAADGMQENPFAISIEVVTAADTDAATLPCDSSDNCGSSCPSACASGSGRY